MKMKDHNNDINKSGGESERCLSTTMLESLIFIYVTSGFIFDFVLNKFLTGLSINWNYCIRLKESDENEVFLCFRNKHERAVVLIVYVINFGRTNTGHRNG